MVRVWPSQTRLNSMISALCFLRTMKLLLLETTCPPTVCFQAHEPLASNAAHLNSVSPLCYVATFLRLDLPLHYDISVVNIVHCLKYTSHIWGLEFDAKPPQGQLFSSQPNMHSFHAHSAKKAQQWQLSVLTVTNHSRTCKYYERNCLQIQK